MHIYKIKYIYYTYPIQVPSTHALTTFFYQNIV